MKKIIVFKYIVRMAFQLLFIYLVFLSYYNNEIIKAIFWLLVQKFDGDDILRIVAIDKAKLT